MSTQKTVSKETFLTYLEKEYRRRKDANPSYSLRAFARHVGIDQSTLSKFFKGEKSFSWPTVRRCLERLSASPDIIALFEEERRVLSSDYCQIEEDHVNMIADWRCYALLEYLKVNPSANLVEIIERFFVTEEEMLKIIDRLERLGFIENNNDRFKLLRPNNSFINNDKTTEARKNLQRSFLTLSQNALEKVAMDQRYHGSLTVAIDKKKLPEIKEKLNNFQEELGNYVQKSSELNDVYQMTLSFFPLINSEDLT